MRALVAVALVAGCSALPGTRPDGFTAPECFPERVSPCQILVAIPDLDFPALVPCTTGVGHADIGKPDHRPCVLCAPAQPLYCETSEGACVPSCAMCTPKLVRELYLGAFCRAEDESWPPSWAPGDMAGGAIGGP